MNKNNLDIVKRYYACKKIIDYGFDGYDFIKKEGNIYIFGKGNDKFFISEKSIVKMLEKTVELMKKVPYVDGAFRVAILVEGYFFHNNSGINTFIKNSILMFKDLGINADIITDYITEKLITNIKQNNATIYLTNMTEYKKDENFLLTTKDDGDIITIADIGEYLNYYKPKCIFSNGIYSTNLMVEYLSIIKAKGIKYFAYTHIGDILALDLPEAYLDFTKKEIKDHLKTIKDYNVPIATQSKGLMDQIKALAPHNKTDVLPLPLHNNKQTPIYTTEDGSYGIIAVTSLSARKNIDLLFEIVGITGLPLTLSTKVKDVGQEKDLYDLAAEYGVQKFNILNNVPNKYIPSLVRRHRCLLHLSIIEMLPYAVLEAIPHIPCIINGSARWAKDFDFKEAIKVDPEDKKETVSVILKTYGDPYLIPKLNEDDYLKKCLKMWKEYLC